MITYADITAQFNIKPGDRIWLSSDIIGLARAFRKETGTRLDQNALLDAFIEAVGQNGTIIIPTFNFDFSNHGYYDYKKSKGTTGALGQTALMRDDFTRTLHPLHSFAVWGADKEYLCSMTNTNSFGTDSPFGYCIGSGVRQVILGTDYVHALTFMHYVESVCNVPYRYMKTFYGTYTTAEGITEERAYIYPVRKLEIRPEECSNLIGAIFEEKGVSRMSTITVAGQEIVSYCLELADAFQILCEDIIHNQCRNIYTFNVPREQIWES